MGAEGDHSQWALPSAGGNGHHWPSADGISSGLSGIGDRLSGLSAPGLKNVRRPKGPVLPAVGIAAAIVVIAGVVVAVRGGGSQASNNTPAAGASPNATASAKPTLQSDSGQQQAATQLAGLLSQSGGDRGDVINAVVAVQNCGSGLSQAQATFAQAAHNRGILLNKLSAMPASSQLNATMISHLTAAWQSSAQADDDLAQWAAAEARGCHKGKTTKNGHLHASYGPDATASADKQAFTKEWNPLAAKYGLPTYKPGQL
jgi:hypothetical protein